MRKPLVEHKDFYYNEAGCVVFTAAYHLAKGYCCGLGCLHCPYNFENVPKPRRTFLQSQRSIGGGINDNRPDHEIDP